MAMRVLYGAARQRAVHLTTQRGALAAPAMAATSLRSVPRHIIMPDHAGGFPTNQELGMPVEQAPVIPFQMLVRAVECLRGVDGWRDVQVSKLLLNVVEGGLTNSLFKLTDAVDNTRQVLVRIYGDGTDEMFDRESEIATFQALSSVGASPRCYGTFQGGRLEEFLPGSSLEREEMKSEQRSEQIAIAVAEFHNSNPPVAGPRESELMAIIAKWLTAAKQQLASELSEADRSIIDSSSFDFSLENLDKEYAEMKKIVTMAKSPLAFVHHDLIPGNFMDVGDKVRLIDFEYGWYDHVAMDIGNHWLEWTVNYDYEGYPHYELRHDEFPTDVQQRLFVKAYLSAAAGGVVPTEHKITAMVTEANMFAVAAHFMWACWGLMQAGKSKIEFGHVQYARDRMEMYAECKRRFLATAKV